MASAITTLKEHAEYGARLGEDGFSGVTKAFNLAQGAFTLLFVLIILAITALVGGEFIDAVPSTGAFGDAIVDMETHGATAMTLFAIGLLIIPAAALIAYLWGTLGGLMGNMNGGVRR